MALNEENGGVGATMLVGPAGVPYYGGNSGFGNGLGGDWGFIILLLLLAGNGGWGFGGGNQMGYDFPWLLNGQNAINNNTNSQFAQAATQTAIGDLAMAVNTGFGNVANGFAQAEIAENARQAAYTNQMFGIQSALQNCCCENRAATADLKYTIAAEACANRQAVNDGIQRLADQMCQDKIDAKNDTIAQLRSELLYARGQSSQDVQTATIQAGQRNLANEIEQYVAPKAVPAYVVQNPNCCSQTYGCGCGM